MGEPISGPTPLKDGDEIEFGHVKGWFIVEARRIRPTTMGKAIICHSKSFEKPEAVSFGQQPHGLESRRGEVANAS